MFPYPSGAGLHVGHPEGYTATDIIARFKRMNGYNVMHPMGWDAFGLPAEQYAIQTGTHPKETTKRNVDRFRSQLKRLGFSYDWSRELSTTDEKYYKWTQWIFLKLFEKGLAYQAEVPVNWCPALGTVLANEEVLKTVAVLFIYLYTCIGSSWHDQLWLSRMAITILQRALVSPPPIGFTGFRLYWYSSEKVWKSP